MGYPLSIVKRFCWAVLLSLLVAGGARAASTDWQGDGNAAVRLLTATEAVGGVDRVTLALEFRFAPGWHGYWRTPGEAGLPPTLDWTGTQNLISADPRFPPPIRTTLLGIETFAYKAGLVLPIDAKLLDGSQPLPLKLGVDYLACAEICVPYRADLALTLAPGAASPAPEAALIAAALAKLPLTSAPAGLTVTAAVLHGDALRLTLAFTEPLSAAEQAGLDLFLEGPGSLTAPRPQVSGSGDRLVLETPLRGVSADAVLKDGLTATLVAGERRIEFPVTPVVGPAVGSTWALMLGAALLGGLILNLMPCVLPVLSLKILGLVGSGGRSRGQVRGDLLAMAAGITVSFLLLAGAAIGVKLAGGAVGWGIQFQQPWFLAGMVGVLALFAGSLLGGREIGLPVAVSSWAGALGQGSRGESFFSGVVATLLATPCSAPFVGTAVGFALGQGPVEILAIFLALALGFAAPFLLLALFPGWAARLPRPGAWMAWVKRGFGLALLGTALWLLTVLAALVAPLGVGLVGAMALALVLAMVRLRRGLAVAVLAGLAGIAALPSLAAHLLPPPVARVSADRLWKAYSAENLAAARAQGQVIFLDITADWCLTCKANKLAVLDRDAARDGLSASGVLALRADWTRPNPEIAEFLKRYGRYGIPFNIVYGPGAPEGIVLPELLTQDAVQAALKQAAGIKS
ncbi:protein-disulfide reductase DsbD family protein [Elstera sp.]|jgi:suppressor for copper-sensitivity B|uniref:protein-disulfide reductase DsbD family protein n=1 Tax=Elstera sp. TaxID=1916664 RepID=UPI0037BFF4D8